MRKYDHHKRLDVEQPWRRWYKLARWQKLRWSVLTRDTFTCRLCRRLEADTSQLVADHIKPHKGSERMFWDADNIQTLCKTCHDGAKQASDKGSQRTTIGLDGWPV